ncbi:MAG: hypothetical protein K8S23_00505 [Candidatus Cloacimonetes bacterium]|nr:hypothetical protein [Candidatus Cloacimonadota bacterium]
MQIIVFDDNKRSNFFPITLIRSTGDLRVGILKLRQRILSFFETEKVNILISKELENIYKERHSKWNVNEFSKEETLFINSRLKIDEEIIKKIDAISKNQALVYQNEIVAIKIDLEETYLSSEILHFSEIKFDKIELTENPFWNYLWNLIKENSIYIQQDFENYFYDKNNKFEMETGVTILNPYNIWIGENVEIKPGVVLDASEGAIIIDEGAKILPNSVIIGPVYIGKKTVIKALAKIYEGTSIGPVCKIGGEVKGIIIQAFSNKQHDGFLGHSYLGEWVNLGADTNNSDYKNSYKNVECYSYPDEKKVDTNSKFMGCIIGDHSKTGINTMINTGTVIGVGCNLLGSDLKSDFIESFSWEIENYDIEKFIKAAEIVKYRRQLLMSEDEKELYRRIFKG